MDFRGILICLRLRPEVAADKKNIDDDLKTFESIQGNFVYV
jgi:hypothetical protein